MCVCLSPQVGLGAGAVSLVDKGRARVEVAGLTPKRKYRVKVGGAEGAGFRAQGSVHPRSR